MRFNAILAVGVTAILVMLSAPTVAAADKPAKASKEATSSQVFVEVKPGDSLSKIASEKKTTYQRIFYANTKIKHPDLIFPGQELRIPSDKEELEARLIPGAVAAAVPSVSHTSAATMPSPQPQPVKAVSASEAGIWDQLAQCESGGNWSINTGNGYYGGLQFTPGSWQAVGGTGLPSNASRSEQNARASELQKIRGWGAWPACASKLGLR